MEENKSVEEKTNTQADVQRSRQRPTTVLVIAVGTLAVGVHLILGATTVVLAWQGYGLAVLGAVLLIGLHVVGLRRRTLRRRQASEDGDAIQ